MRFGCSPPMVFFGVLVTVLTILTALSNPFVTAAVATPGDAVATATPYAGCSLMDPRCYRALSLPSPIH